MPAVSVQRKQQIERRRMSAYTMVQQGVSQGIIAEKLGVTRRQIEIDLSKIRKEIAAKLTKNDYLIRIVDYNERQRERIQRWWKMISDPKSSKRDIAKALTELRNEDDQLLKKDQMIGLLPKEQSPLTIETNTDGDGISNIQINIIQQQEEPELVENAELPKVETTREPKIKKKA